jgi:hypothetical protein
MTVVLYFTALPGLSEPRFLRRHGTAGPGSWSPVRPRSPAAHHPPRTASERNLPLFYTNVLCQASVRNATARYPATPALDRRIDGAKRGGMTPRCRRLGIDGDGRRLGVITHIAQIRSRLRVVPPRRLSRQSRPASHQSTRQSKFSTRQNAAIQANADTAPPGAATDKPKVSSTARLKAPRPLVALSYSC